MDWFQIWSFVWESLGQHTVHLGFSYNSEVFDLWILKGGLFQLMNKGNSEGVEGLGRRWTVTTAEEWEA